jgi:hypothetical protein
MTVSFWYLPGGNEDCARFDGTLRWLWADTDCKAKLNFICQHRKNDSINSNPFVPFLHPLIDIIIFNLDK